MQLKTLLWLFLAAVLIGGWQYYTHTPRAVAPTVPTATTTPATATPPKAAARQQPAPAAKKPTAVTAKIVGVGPITYLLSLKQDLACTVKTQSGYPRSGTMYVSAAGKMRGTFVNSAMIDDGMYLYAWMTGAIKGIVLPASASASGSAIATAGGIDLATDIAYACNPWTVDTSVFTPPSSVSFFSSL